MNFSFLATLALVLLPPFMTVSATEPDADPFAEGAIWVGEFRVAAKDTEFQNWALTVSERKGKTFKGEVVVKKRDKDVETFKVEGTATEKNAGPVVFKSEKQGLRQVKLTGKLLNGEAVLVFSGTNQFGKPGAGIATLKPKN